MKSHSNSTYMRKYLNPTDYKNPKSYSRSTEDSEKTLVSYEKDIELKKINFQNIIKNVESLVKEKEKRRDFKMQSEFDREKNDILDKHKNIRDKIDENTRNNMNERVTNILKNSCQVQQELYNRYYTLNSELEAQIYKLKSTLPDLHSKIQRKSEKLKKINQENLILMEKLNIKLKIEPSHGKSTMRMVNTNDSFEIEKTKNFSVLDPENNLNYHNKSQITTRFKYTEYGKDVPNYLNISDVFEDNIQLRLRYAKIRTLKENLSEIKNKNKEISNKISELNSQYFNISQVFSEGINEISKELLKIHELQLDKIISKNPSGNNLYFELLKDKNPSNSTELKLPLINSAVIKKYNYSVIEKGDASTFIYNVIKNMLNEHYMLNKSMNIKKKKFDWEEFKKFSGYQIYTLICLNKQAFKIIEQKIFPKRYHANVNPKELIEVNEEPLKYQ